MQDALSLQVGSGWRTVPAEAIEEQLLVGGYVFELREGRRSDAVRDLHRLLGPASEGGHDPGEIIRTMIERGLRGENPFWLSRYVSTGRRLVTDLWRSEGEGLPDLSQLPPRAFRVDFRRTFNTRLIQAGSRSRFRMPLPFEDEHLTDLQLTVDPQSQAIRVSPGRLEIAPVTFTEDRLTLAASFSFTARPGVSNGASGSEADLAIWMSEKEGSIQVTSAVRALADQLDDPSAPAFERVMAFRDHLIDTMACGMIHSECLHGPAAVDWVLANRWFDCRIGSALLAALCRAKGIPARLIGGYLLWDAPTEHYWIEAWLPDRGWTPFDLLAWDLSAGGRDPDWRDIYAGTIDYRMKTQVFPHVFTGAPGVPMQAPWHRVSRATEHGTETQFLAIPDMDLLYADEVRVFRA